MQDSRGLTEEANLDDSKELSRRTRVSASLCLLQPRQWNPLLNLLQLSSTFSFLEHSLSKLREKLPCSIIVLCRNMAIAPNDRSQTIPKLGAGVEVISKFSVSRNLRGCEADWTRVGGLELIPATAKRGQQLEGRTINV